LLIVKTIILKDTNFKLNSHMCGEMGIFFFLLNIRFISSIYYTSGPILLPIYYTNNSIQPQIYMNNLHLEPVNWPRISLMDLWFVIFPTISLHKSRNLIAHTMIWIKIHSMDWWIQTTFSFNHLYLEFIYFKNNSFRNIYFKLFKNLKKLIIAFSSISTSRHNTNNSL